MEGEGEPPTAIRSLNGQYFPRAPTPENPHQSPGIEPARKVMHPVILLATVCIGLGIVPFALRWAFPEWRWTRALLVVAVFYFVLAQVWNLEARRDNEGEIDPLTKRFKVLGIWRAALKEELLKGHDVIRLTEFFPPVFVSERFAQVFRERKFTGATLPPVPVISQLV